MRWLVVVCFLGACFYTEDSPLPEQFGVCTTPDEDTGIADPTWYRDIEPLVTTKCQGCHTDGGIAPFSLQGYSQFSSLRGVIHDAVVDKRMPPWQPDDCCNKYQ